MRDRFTILEQLNLHQRCIDKGWGREQVDLYNRFYWSEARFNVNDLRTSTFEGLDGMKQMFDHAHIVFPMDKWFHSMVALTDSNWSEDLFKPFLDAADTTFKAS